MQLSKQSNKRKNNSLRSTAYNDMVGLDTSIVQHHLPTDETMKPVKQKPRKFKPDMSLKIKEQIIKQFRAWYGSSNNKRRIT